MPNFNVETYPPATGYYDYMNYVYVGKYDNDLESLSTINGDEKEITHHPTPYLSPVRVPIISSEVWMTLEFIS